jgi:3-hydroxyacyl-CoA dehydrogenase/enoyl-CoA hydratase/3-hydroxybutyryl-CoA epimerase
MMIDIFHHAVDSDGIATLAWDLPGKSMNVMTEAGLIELAAKLEAALTDPAIKGVILTSSKADFAGGMDLNVLAEMKAAAGSDPAQGLFDGIMSMHKLLRRVELAGADPKTMKGGKPMAWACPGTAAGIGLELGLACHRRIVADDPKAKIGLPEIKVGIFPGAGGTTRVSRMLGVMAAAPILLEGKMLSPAKAKAAGLVDEIVAPDQLLARAKEWILAATPADIIKPWDTKKERIPGGEP